MLRLGLGRASEPSPDRGVPPPTSVLDQALAAQLGDERGDFALDRAAVVVERALTRSAISASAPPAWISRTTAAAVGLSV